MTHLSSVDSEIQGATSVPDMLQAVTKLRQVDSVEPLVYLANFHRRAPGWLTVVVSGLVRLTFGLLMIAAATALVVAGTISFFNLNRSLVTTLYPGRETVWAVLLLAVTAFVIYRAEGVRALWHYRAVSLPSITDLPARLRPVLLGLLRLVEGIVQATMILLVAALLTMTLNPFFLLLFNLGNLFNGWWLARAEIGAMLGHHWLPTVISVLLVLLVIFLLRHSARSSLIHANLMLWGGASLVDWGAALQRTDPSWFNDQVLLAVDSLWDVLVTAVPVISSFGADIYWPVREAIQAAPSEAALLTIGFMALLYPIGGAVGLAQCFYVPYTIFHHAFYWLVQRWQLRWRLSATLRYHRQRNQAQVAHDRWAAVCRLHLRRCETRRATMGYRRKVAYACCPVCRSDNQLYTDVQCVALYLDERMATPTLQKEGTLLLNGLEWLKSSASPPVVDALVIGQVDPHDVELGVTLYQEKADPSLHKSLDQISGRILNGVQPSPNTLRILRQNLRGLEEGYDPDSSSNACIQSARLQDAVQYRSQRLRRALIKSVWLALFFLGLTAIILFGSSVWQQAAGWWEMVPNETLIPFITGTPTPTPMPTSTPIPTPTPTPPPYLSSDLSLFGHKVTIFLDICSDYA